MVKKAGKTLKDYNAFSLYVSHVGTQKHSSDHRDLGVSLPPLCWRCGRQNQSPANAGVSRDQSGSRM